MSKVIYYLVAAVLMGSLCLGCAKAPPPASEVITLSFADFLSPMDVGNEANMIWIDKVQDGTNGKVKIDMYAGGSLLEWSQVVDGVISGIADIGCDETGGYAGRFPLLDYMNHPLGIPNLQIYNHVVWDLQKEFQPEEWSDVKVLWIYGCGPLQVITKTPIRTLKDFQGMRIHGGAESKNILAELGANPIPGNAYQAYEKAQKGMIDGQAASADVIMDLSLNEVFDYVTFTNHVCCAFFVVMNMDVWNSLPPDVQKVFDEASEEMIGLEAEMWGARADEAVAKAVELGTMETIYLSSGDQATIKSIGDSLSEDYVKSLEAQGVKDARAYAERVNALVEKYS